MHCISEVRMPAVYNNKLAECFHIMYAKCGWYVPSKCKTMKQIAT